MFNGLQTPLSIRAHVVGVKHINPRVGLAYGLLWQDVEVYVGVFSYGVLCLAMQQGGNACISGFVNLL